MSIKKIISVILSVTMLVSLLPLSASAVTSPKEEVSTISFDEYSVDVIGPNAAAEIEALIAENEMLNMQLDNETISEEIALKIRGQIARNDERVQELGGSAPPHELLEDLILSVMNQYEVQSTNNWHPSDLASDLSVKYNVSSSYATSYGGKSQYHLVLKSNDKDPYLKINKSEHFYDSITPGSTEAQKWVKDVIKIYAEKFIGAGLGVLHPALSFLPYELLGLESQPDENSISSAGDATELTVNTVTTVKFVYVLEESTNEWVYALSTNRVSFATTVTQLLSINNRAYNKSTDLNGLYDNGDYYSASADANSAFAAGITRNTCVGSINASSEEKPEIVVVVPIKAPTYVVDMI